VKQSAFFLALLSLATGCAANSIDGTSQKKGDQKATTENEKTEVTDGKGEELENPEESEDLISDVPVEVTGAFVTKIDTVTFDDVKARPGFRLIVINVYEKYSSLKVKDPVRILELSFTAKGELQKFKPLRTPTLSRNIVHAIF
jgi:hypothetical protein